MFLIGRYVKDRIPQFELIPKNRAVNNPIHVLPDREAEKIQKSGGDIDEPHSLNVSPAPNLLPIKKYHSPWSFEKVKKCTENTSSNRMQSFDGIRMR